MTLAPSRFAVSVAAACLLAAQPAPAGAQDSGEALYAKRCAMCHDKDVPRAPRRDTLAADVAGSHPRFASGRNDGAAGRRAVACREAGDRGVCRREGVRHWRRCGGPLLRERACLHRRRTGVGRLGRRPGERTVPGEARALARRLDQLKVRWAFGFPGSILAYGAPAVAGGRVFVGSAGGEVYALDAAHGMRPLELHRGSVGARGAERRPIEGWPHRRLLRRSERAALRARRRAWHSALASRWWTTRSQR